MKLSSILVLIALSAIAHGNMFAAAARGLYQPIILSIGAVFATIDQKKIEPIFNDSEKEVKKVENPWSWDGYFDRNMNKKKWDDPKVRVDP